MATRLVDRRVLSNLGIYVYGAGAISLDVSGLVWIDFASNWQRVQGNVPHRGALACIAAVYELAAGAAILWRRTARTGAMMLTILYSVFALVVGATDSRVSSVYDVWGNFFEEFSLVAAMWFCMHR
jgi:uncharacterized membrane protein YphA (DoxX/SURF4 family)